jgi:hypothetical protein
MADGMYQIRQFLLSRCVGALKSAFAPGRGGVNAVQEQVSISMSVELLTIWPFSSEEFI